MYSRISERFLFSVFIVSVCLFVVTESVCVFSLSANGTGVFWDMDQCKIPAGRTSSDLVPFLREMMLSVGLRGPTSIRIYGDLTGLDFQASASEDVKLNHFHAGY